MTRLEAIIYAIGKLDEIPKNSITSAAVQLSDCHSCFEKGYQISRVNVFDNDNIYLDKTNPDTGCDEATLMYLNRDAFDIHETAVLIDTAYGAYLKRHKNE